MGQAGQTGGRLADLRGELSREFTGKGGGREEEEKQGGYSRGPLRVFLGLLRGSLQEKEQEKRKMEGNTVWRDC